MRRKSKKRAGKLAEKVARAITAKSSEGRVNYLIDILAEEVLDNKAIDTILHGINEIGLGKGPVDKKLLKFIRKTLRYRA